MRASLLNPARAGQIAFSLLLLASSAVPFASAASSDLEQAFKAPPAEARPWVYWFWLNGNITKEGITADLEAMKRAGIGGVLIMEVDQGAPVGPADFMGPQWRELFKHVAKEAQRLGLEINMNNDAGWNGSGGPWIKPEESMQKVVFTETDVEGPKPFDGTLAQPQAAANFYRDIAVLAFPAVGAYRIEDISHKAAYTVGTGSPAARKELPGEMRIDRERIVDITDKMDKAGHLTWDVPAGKWTIIRFGHTTTGMVNAPAPLTGRGLECDKLSKEGIEANFAGMMDKIIHDVGPLAGKTLVTTHIDSWENGSQNWTAKMRDEFKQRRGYDMLKYFPTYTGRVVGTLEESERFLSDLRQTVSDLVVENYAGHLQKLAFEHGLKLSIEAYGGPTDDLPYGGRADEPMCEFWIGAFMYANAKEMASIAHTYGRPILGAEAFTATDTEKWKQHPGSIKALGDEAFCAGVNRFVFHRYAMQPWLDRRPGMCMGPWGLHYERTETWWEQSGPWHEYLTRCQYLLRQGLFVADVVHLQPERAPQGFNGHEDSRYDFDNCCAEVVLDRMAVKDGRIVLPDGMSYRVLALPSYPTMTPTLLRKLKELVQAGATIVGSKPVRSPSLSGYPACDQEVEQLAAELWGNCDGGAVNERAFGQGRVFCGQTPDQVLEAMHVSPDFESRSPLHYIHRRTADADIYFVANPEPVNMTAVCSFRVKGKRPELWQPLTGTIEPAAMYKSTETGTDVLLSFEASGSVFVVFRKESGSSDPFVSVQRDGKPVVTLNRPARTVVIDKAVYGVPGDEARTRDVTQTIQQLVDAGQYTIQVASLAAKVGDPAVNVVKTLTVEYHIGDWHGKASGTDPESVAIARDSHKIVVNKARYGVLDDPARTRDVRQKLQKMLDQGARDLQVRDMAAGDDPAYMVLKTLVVECTIDGKPEKFTGTDNDRIRFINPQGEEVVADVLCSSVGQLQLRAWKPGRYTAETASGKRIELDAAALPQPRTVDGPWQVQFGQAAPVMFDKLASWSERSEPDIKYFSGTAVYRTTINIPSDALAKNQRVFLDLGQVEIMADVKLNGRSLGLLWKSPYHIDITEAARSGENALEIAVTNLWVNRMIGDEQLPEDSDRNPDGTLKTWPTWLSEGKPSPTGRQTFTSWRLWKKSDPLLPSGILGPVQLIPVAVQE